MIKHDQNGSDKSFRIFNKEGPINNYRKSDCMKTWHGKASETNVATPVKSHQLKTTIGPVTDETSLIWSKIGLFWSQNHNSGAQRGQISKSRIWGSTPGHLSRFSETSRTPGHLWQPCILTSLT